LPLAAPFAVVFAQVNEASSVVVPVVDVEVGVEEASALQGVEQSVGVFPVAGVAYVGGVQAAEVAILSIVGCPPP
jgi:prophage tail gpP-like protein